MDHPAPPPGRRSARLRHASELLREGAELPTGIAPLIARWLEDEACRLELGSGASASAERVADRVIQ